MNQQAALYLKLGLVIAVVVGVFVLAGMGKIDAAAALDRIVTVTGALVVALGVSGGASGVAAQMAKSAGNVTSVATAKVASIAPIAGVLLFVFAFGSGAGIAMSSAGCTPKAQTAVEEGGVALAVCVMNHWGEPAAQVAIECGAATVEQVQTIFDTQKALMDRLAADAGPVKP